jgi:alpha-beta hydrolase superfamily lysophospholipase
MAQALLNAMREEKIEGAAGKLLIRSLRPVGTTRGVVMIVPGFNSHSGYYGWAADQLAAMGLAVYAVDLRGRGQSDGERFYVEDLREYVNDVERLAGVIASREPSLPVFLLGHSAGGVVSCCYTLDHQAGLKGLICEDFAFQVPAPDFALAVVKGLSHLVPHAHALKLNNRDFSRDPKAVQAMNDDPFIKDEAQPTATVAAMVRADERLKKEFPLVTLPVLILHGTADKVTKPSGSQFFYDTAGSADKTIKLYEGHYHDLLTDVDREKVMADIKTWIDARLNVRSPAAR